MEPAADLNMTFFNGVCVCVYSHTYSVSFNKLNVECQSFEKEYNLMILG